MRETTVNLSALEDEYLRLVAKLREIHHRYEAESQPVREAMEAKRAEQERRDAAEWQHRRGRQPRTDGDRALLIAFAEAAPEPEPVSDARTWQREQLKRLAEARSAGE